MSSDERGAHGCAGACHAAASESERSDVAVKLKESRDRLPFFRSVPVPFPNVRMTDAFWAPRQQTVLDRSLDWATAHFDRNGGLAALRSMGANYRPDIRTGDIESVKFVEALAMADGLSPDPAVEALAEAWGQEMAASQAQDGYFTFGWQANGTRVEERWQCIWFSHEDYALGHYIESALSLREFAGAPRLLESAIRAADNMAATFLDSDRAYAPAHPEIEQALMRLYEATGNRRYVKLAGWLIAQRGRHEHRSTYGKYAQDHSPVTEQRTIEGHAVRAAFLFNGVTQYVGATGDPALRAAALAAFDDLVTNKLYLHGGSGNKSALTEGYRETGPFLGLDDCYGETCGAYANIRWAHSLARLTGDARYLDTAEQILFNLLPASLSLSGDRFFYENPAQASEPLCRYTWHIAACCPPNIVKSFMSVGGLFYSLDDEGIFVNHYGASEAAVPFGSGIRLVQSTNFPWDGAVSLRIEPNQPEVFALRMRIPSWAKGASASVNGVPVPCASDGGWLSIRRTWQQDDEVRLDLPMAVERVRRPGVEGYEGKVALKRGPIVYCLEQQDIAEHPWLVCLPNDVDVSPRHRPGLLGGVTVLEGDLLTNGRMQDSPPISRAMFVPYGSWANRTPGVMLTWLQSEQHDPAYFLDAVPRDPPPWT